MSKSGLFLGGVPTEPDVKKLIETFSNLSPGDEIRHDNIAALLGQEQGSNRYKSIVGAWRRRLYRNHNVDLEAVPGLGFRVLNSIERVSAGVRGIGKNVRGLVRSEGRIRNAPAEQLSQQQQGVREHVLRHTGALVDSARRASKEIAVKFTPQAQLPRARPVR